MMSMDRTIDYLSNGEISFLLKRLKAHDRQTFEHSLRTADYALQIANQFNFTDEEQAVLVRSALVHDIGKLQISAAELHSKTRSCETNRQLLYQAEHGVQLLQHCIEAGLVDREIILYQQENLDGSGTYGMKADQLSISSRILRVAHFFDSYIYGAKTGRALLIREAFDELFCWRGILFDSFVVDALYAITYPNIELKESGDMMHPVKLQQEIEELRADLIAAYQQFDHLTHPSVVRISEQLDHKLNLYQKMQSEQIKNAQDFPEENKYIGCPQ